MPNPERPTLNVQRGADASGLRQKCTEPPNSLMSQRFSAGRNDPLIRISSGLGDVDGRDSPVPTNNTIAKTLFRKLKQLLRAFRLLWGRLGRARIYVAALVGIVIVLAAVGVWHILNALSEIGSSTRQTAALAPPVPIETKVKGAKPSPIIETATSTPRKEDRVAELSSQSPAPSPTAGATPADERAIAITDVKQTKKRGRRGETLVTATVGMASHSNLEKDDLEIRISFFDLTDRNELRPTDALVTYRWLTPVRDWSDPTPKYLAATYLSPPQFRSFERVRYGGFLIRIYVDGKLQDERSEPSQLLAMLRTERSPELEPEVAPDDSSDSEPSTGNEKTATPARSPLPSPSALPEKKGSRDSMLPYGKPVPGKPGFVSSPFDPRFIIDVRGFPPGTLVNDPNTNKPFRVP